MKYNGKILTTLGLMGVAAWVVVTSLKWPFRTALFPVIIGILMLLIAIVELFLSVREGKKIAENKLHPDSSSTEEVDQPLTACGLLLAWAWTLGFFLLILFFGFTISIPIFTLIYLKFQGKEEWGMSIGLTATALLSFYGLFVRILHIHFTEGWLQKILRLIGAG